MVNKCMIANHQGAIVNKVPWAACVASLLWASGLAWGQKAPEPAPADVNPMSPGAWEVRNEALGEGKALAPKTSNVCIDQGWIDEQHWLNPTELKIKNAVSCKMEGYERVVGSSSWSTLCAMPRGGQVVVKYERRASAENVLLVTDIRSTAEGKSRQLTLRTGMRRVGNSCAAGVAKLTASKK
jgi:hypothetical protein